MAIEAPYSKFNKANLKIYIAVCIGLAIWCAYDGYFNEEWIQDHEDADGNPEPYLVINRKAPPFLIGVAALIGGYLFVMGKKKVVVGENELAINNKEKISYDSIQRLDKTNFDAENSKGYFIITYKDINSREVDYKLKCKTYDNLGAILDHLVSKIS